MTSARKIEANRRNAKKSTGPKTWQGKARSSQNARKHGLSLSALHDPEAARAIEGLAGAIAGAGPSIEQRERAWRIATAQIDIERTRQARCRLLAEPIETPGLTERLVLIDRYERRARSRRKFAIRNFGSLAGVTWRRRIKRMPRRDGTGRFGKTNPTERGHDAFWQNEPNANATQRFLAKRTQPANGGA
jgi:hypothetical protein